MRAGIAVALAALATSGCDNLRASATPDAPLWLHHPGSAIAITGRRDLTAETRKVGEQYERGKPEIDAVHRRVFVGSSDRGLYAIRASDLATLWRFETLGAVQCEPLYDPGEDVVYFGSNDGALYKVRAVDGHLLWRFSSNAEIARRPVLRDGIVYVMNANDTLIAIHASNGALKWHQHRTPAFGMEVAGYAGPALGKERIFTAFSDGVVMAYAIDDGSEQWPSVDLAAAAEQSQGGDVRYFDVDTTPVLDRTKSGDVVFVAGYSGGVFALDAEDGARVWSNDKATGVTELVMWRQPAHELRRAGANAGDKTAEIAEKKILIASSGLTGLWGIDPEDGRTLWRRNLPEGGISAPLVIENALLVGTTRYGLFLFSPLDGALMDGVETGSGFAMTPAGSGRRAFVMSNGGALVSLYIDPPLHGVR